MNRPKAGFVLLEAVLSVLLVSICLTFITQSLLTNFRTGVRFQEAIRSFMVMQNQLGLIYVTKASDDLLDAYPKPLEEPYERFSAAAQAGIINDHLKKIDLKLIWPAGRTHGHLDLTTIIYDPNQSQNNS